MESIPWYAEKAPINIHQDNESSLHGRQYTRVRTDMMMHKNSGKTVQPITKANYTSYYQYFIACKHCQYIATIGHGSKP
jgi:hypothetical protein